jgi:hypothetical protein
MGRASGLEGMILTFKTEAPKKSIFMSPEKPLPIAVNICAEA